ncbi:hypothetical protein B0H13DRAFT_1927666 [Mycena leptocephala]|nr:hypothetical protein B0H13DRAFT_1927666 [Mycena leptocephala]
MASDFEAVLSAIREEAEAEAEAMRRRKSSEIRARECDGLRRGRGIQETNITPVGSQEAQKVNLKAVVKFKDTHAQLGIRRVLHIHKVAVGGGRGRVGHLPEMRARERDGGLPRDRLLCAAPGCGWWAGGKMVWWYWCLKRANLAGVSSDYRENLRLHENTSLGIYLVERANNYATFERLRTVRSRLSRKSNRPGALASPSMILELNFGHGTMGIGFKFPPTSAAFVILHAARIEAAK